MTLASSLFAVGIEIGVGAKYQAAESYHPKLIDADLSTTDTISTSRISLLMNTEITSISFPKEVEEAIEKKMVELAKADGYKYILEAARQEAQRKEIEAEGIRKFQDIVRPGLSDNYLRWRGVEATQSLATSNNSKIIIFGSGPTGLPLVLGDMDKTIIPPKASKGN